MSCSGMNRLTRLLSALLLLASFSSRMLGQDKQSPSAPTDEFKCPDGTKDSGSQPGMIVRWCEIQHDGRLLYHGPVWRWHRNGQMAGKERYVYGSAEGEFPSWYENGKRSSLGNFSKGSKVGLWKYWDPEGRLKTEVTYTDKGNKRTDYYPSGQKMATGTSTKSGKIGMWIYWDAAGKEKARCDYGEGLFALPNQDCELIAKELDPTGFSPPIPAGKTLDNQHVEIRIASQVYGFSIPEGWVADVEAGKEEGVPLVFYPQGSAWRKSDATMYIRPKSKSGHAFQQTVKAEIEGFRDGVAEFHEDSGETRRLKTGQEYLLKTVSYKPLISTDSPFSVVASNVIHETIAYLNVSENTVLVVVLSCNSEAQMKKSSPDFTSMLDSFRSIK